jgi:uncharacterized membrane protein
MIRNKAAKLRGRAQNIVWRSHEPSRLETFSDGVFAFALTLIIVSVEVPKSFADLMETMKGTLSFAVCFAALFQIWNSQNIFFRRYGMKDDTTILLNAILMFVVLIYAYPLKFLSILVLVRNTYVVNGHEFPMLYDTQASTLMIIYGAGFTIIQVLFLLMHLNAIKYAEELKLTPIELHETKTVAYANFIGACIGILAMLMALMLPLKDQGLSGFTYFLIPIAYWLWYSYRGRRGRQLYKKAA